MGRCSMPPQRLNFLLLSIAVLAAFILSGPAHPQQALPSVINLNSHTPAGGFEPGAELRLLDLLNRVRLAAGLRPVIMDGSLRWVARVHARDTAIQGFVGAGSPQDHSFLDRLAGIVRAGTFAAENVTIAGTVEQAQDAFAADQAHLKNMLDPGFHRVGIGVVTAGQLDLVITEDFSE